MPKAKTNRKPNRTPSRKQLFRSALGLAEMTAREWAEQEGVTEGHLSHVLSGDRESVTLCDKIDAFIERYSINDLPIAKVS